MSRRQAEATAEPLPVLRGYPGDAAITEKLLSPLRRGSRAWRALLFASIAGTLLLVLSAGYTLVVGIGAWGNNIPVAWAFAIINFVWWIGLGHAGTFISAFLVLLMQKWRTSINRVAEAMTLFALVQAGLFPLLHLGRPWFFYWLIPYPSRMEVWPQFRSALPWDIAAVITYSTVSLIFWYVGLIPDLAAARDHFTSKLKRRLYGIFALGWRGSGRDWHHYRIAYGLLAGLATPLVISVHSIVSLDFSIAQLPGWHSTIFPPYFVVGAIYSGFALVLMLLIPVRRIFDLKDVITERHLNVMAKLLLATGSMMLYAYIIEAFIAWYSGNDIERFLYLQARPFGPYAFFYWCMIAFNVVTPQIFWVPKLRINTKVLFAASTLILIGMWVERFVIVVTSLSQDFLPSSWHVYMPTWVDLGILFGTVGFFSLLFLLFLRFVPFIPIAELRKLAYEMRKEEGS
jgi:molybdopterin-containing oxidoreductase family membrane subunit